MPGPGSYTRDDVLEIQCHGGPAAARGVLDAVLACGVRLADPGEFTLRAYLNGRLDLLQAEAVLDVVRARTEAALRIHEGLLGGRLSREVQGWQESLTGALALVEAYLDFPDEDVGELDRERVRVAVADLTGALEEKLATFAWGRTSRDGFGVALVGAPNTGKSSLLNRLLEEERAIVSPVPGTTRDTIEAWLNALGVSVRIFDTAGLRGPADSLEAEGVRRARAAAEGADLVVFVTDGSRELGEDEAQEAQRLASRGRVLGVVNKGDLGDRPLAALRRVLGGEPLVVSARTGARIDSLLEALRQAAWGGTGTGDAVPLTHRRHREAVERAAAALRRGLAAWEQGTFPEVAASELHEAHRCLGELLGWGTPDDVLEEIFSRFCIGK
jgi:tRNA modification GTPase